ncbi:hypothetical protein GCM10011509_11820 [Ornithinimicrobium pekingense]|uniref:Uncharacterized protein n=1 Tax=Ornithinimicrobium pekingense TaxID=384677 RepID=A0ABQ2F909_9MICO|nr:hypothetical protein GCM10011509_11820 [Ornithinimicrobium pekingense]
MREGAAAVMPTIVVDVSPICKGGVRGTSRQGADPGARGVGVVDRTQGWVACPGD